MAGRPPTPTALRLVQQGGKLRARHANKAKREPVPELGVGDPPGHLTDEQVSIWCRLRDDSPVGLLTKCDRDLFEGYCVILAARNVAARKANAGGSGSVRALSTYVRLTDQLRHLQAQLGYSPAARTRVAVT